MAKIRIVGDSSGYVELAAPNAAGNNTLELPSSGTRLVGSDSDGNVSVSGIVTAATFSGNLNSTGVSTVTTLSATSIVGVTTAGITTAYINTLSGISTISADSAVYINQNLVFPSGKGIDFSATTDSSGTMTSELLSDYEEGTWTAGLSYVTPGTSSFGYTYQTGWYCKVGSLVHVTWDIRLNAFTKGTASGGLIITGFPFTSINTGDYARANSWVFLYQWPYSVAAGQVPFVSMRQAGNTYADTGMTVTNAVSVALADPDADSMMFGALVYRAS